MFSHYSYTGLNFTSQSNSVLFGFKREWSRQLNTNVSLGPQWIESSDSMIVPSSTGITANASVNYQLRFGSASLTYYRGTNSGAGYLLGAKIDSASANFSRDFGSNLAIGFTGTYQRTAGLQNNGVTNAKYGEAQATRRLGQYFIVFASYTTIDQSSSSPLPANALSGLTQVVGFGIGYSPRVTHIRR
jgi:hypothetical protein